MIKTEFQTIINEPYIHIPNYETLKGHKVKVVLIDIDNNQKTKNYSNNNFINDIINNPRHIKPNDDFLSRDKANER